MLFEATVWGQFAAQLRQLVQCTYDVHFLDLMLQLMKSSPDLRARTNCIKTQGKGQSLSSPHGGYHSQVPLVYHGAYRLG